MLAIVMVNKNINKKKEKAREVKRLSALVNTPLIKRINLPSDVMFLYRRILHFKRQLTFSRNGVLLCDGNPITAILERINHNRNLNRTNINLIYHFPGCKIQLIT